MSAIQQWLKDLEAVATLSITPLDVQKFKPVKLDHQIERLNQQQLKQKISDFSSMTGWILETGQVHTLNQQKFNGSSVVLTGEWVVDGLSYSLEHLGRDQWELCQYNLQACKIGQATHLAEKMLHQEVSLSQQRYLVYQRLWQVETEGTIAPMNKFAIFSGFEEKSK